MGRVPAHRAAGGYRMSIIRFVFVLGLLFIASPFMSSAHAVDPVPTTEYKGTWNAFQAPSWQTSLNAAGADAIAVRNSNCTIELCGQNTMSCTFSRAVGAVAYGFCPTDEYAVASIASRTVCPAGYTKSGTAPNEICTPTQTTCGLAVGTVTRSGYFAIGTDSSGANFAGSPCLSACTNTFFIDSLWSVLVDGVKNYYFKGYFRVVGAGPNGDYCSPDTANAPTPSAGVPAPTCPAGQSVGYVNGVPLCYTPTTPPPPGALPPVTTTTTTATVTNPDNSTTTTNTVNNPDSSQTITTTVTDPNGNKSTTVQQVPPPDKPTADQFCQNNPDAEVCKKKSECEKNPKAVGCAELGDTPAAEDILKRDIPITFNPVSIPENATCPAPVNLNIAGHNIPIDYDPICQFAAGIRPVFLAVAYLSAALIMIGGIRENA